MEGFIAEALKAVSNLGIAGGPVFFLLYLMERNERRKSAADIVALTRESVAATKETAGGLDRVADHTDEVRTSIAKVAEAVTLLTARH